MVEELLQAVETYVSCQQKTVAHFIATRPIMYLCLVAERRQGSKVTNLWWEHDGLDTEGERTADQEAKRTEGGEDTDGAEIETY